MVQPKKGRRLGGSGTHQKAIIKNLAISLACPGRYPLYGKGEPPGNCEDQMSFKKFFVAMLFMVSCLTILTACGGGGGGSSPVPETGAKEHLGTHEASIPDQPNGTLILGGQ